jgi:hypothetical protein
MDVTFIAAVIVFIAPLVVIAVLYVIRKRIECRAGKRG